jgi:hypothetical protein
VNERVSDLAVTQASLVVILETAQLHGGGKTQFISVKLAKQLPTGRRLSILGERKNMLQAYSGHSRPDRIGSNRLLQSDPKLLVLKVRTAPIFVQSNISITSISIG